MDNYEHHSEYNESIGEWILDEVRGWYFYSYNINELSDDNEDKDEVVLESNNKHVSYHIWNSCSQLRNLRSGEITFDISKRMFYVMIVLSNIIILFIFK